MNRRVPLRRSDVPLSRGTGLARVTPLERGGELARSVPLRRTATLGSASPARPATRYSGPSPAVRRLVLARDNWCCVCCGRSIVGQRYSLAHRLRAGQLGEAVPVNLIVLLGLGGEQHHGRVDLYKDPADAVKGYRLRSGQDPATVPVAYAVPEGLAWFLLNADGSRTEVDEPEASAA